MPAKLFGLPDQVELLVAIRNGMFMWCEIKISIDEAGMYIVEHKVRFYAGKYKRDSTRIKMICPIIASKTMQLFQTLGIQPYSDSTMDVYTD